jgi:hypothetical protein
MKLLNKTNTEVEQSQLYTATLKNQENQDRFALIALYLRPKGRSFTAKLIKTNERATDS